MAGRKRKRRNNKRSVGIIRSSDVSSFSSEAMKTYGSYVILDRAVADVRDGLKPVQRRILWAMHELRLSTGFKKSAKIVGDVMGNFHPHGDASIYQTMVNMVGDRYPLVEGHGNFGGPTDSAASMRYTEARLSPLASSLFKDIEVASLIDNYSGDRKEPLVLPSRIPLLLLNGSSGIGVGLRASVPPHNLRELVRCLIYFIKKENPRIGSIVKNMPGPDYGQGVLLSSSEDVTDLYKTGKGTLHYRCNYSFDYTEDTPLLVVNDLAPGFNLSSFLKKMRSLADDSLIEFCSDATSSSGVRVYIGFKDPVVIRDRVIPELHTTQNYSFYVVQKEEEDNSLCEDNLFQGGLFRLFEEFVSFRRTVEKLRLRREFSLAKEKLLKARAVLSAIKNLDHVYEVLRSSHSSLSAMREAMSSALSISEEQAQHVLNMKVHRLALMNKDEVSESISGIKEELYSIKDSLSDIDGVIVKHLKELLPFSDDRGTVLSDDCPPPTLDMSEASSWVMSKNSKISRIQEPPSRRNRFDLIVETKAFVTAVYQNNNAEVLTSSYLTEHSPSSDVVGIISDSCTSFAVLNADNRYVVVKHPAGSKKKFNLIKDTKVIQSCAGIYPGGDLYFISDNNGIMMPSSDIKSTRPFVRSTRSPLDNTLRVLSLSPGSALYDSTGKSPSISKDGTFDFTGNLYVIGDRNFVLVKSGKGDIVSLKKAVSLLREGQLEYCWNLLGN